MVDLSLNDPDMVNMIPRRKRGAPKNPLALRSDNPLGSILGNINVEEAQTMVTALQNQGYLPTGDGDEMPGLAEEPAAQTDDEGALERIFGLMDNIGGGNAWVFVYQLTPGKPPGHCGKFTVMEFEEGGDLDLIRINWGPGEYRLDLRGPISADSTKVALLKRSTIRVIGKDAPIMSGNPTAGGNNQLAEVLRSMQETQGMLLKAISERPDPTQQLLSTLTLMKTMKEAMGISNTPAPAANDLGTFMKTYSQFKEFAGEFSKDKGDGPSDIENLTSMGLEIIKSIPRGTQPAQETAMPAVAMPQSMRLPAPTHAPNPAPAKSTTEDDDMSMKLKVLVFSIVTKAQAGLDEKGEPILATVQEFAEYIYNKAPEEVLDILETPAWWEFLTLEMKLGDLLPHQKWVTAVRNRVMEIMAEEAASDEEETGDETTPGNLPRAE